jgi:hypothetical protein
MNGEQALGTAEMDALRAHIKALEEINEGLRQSFEELTALYRLSETMATARTLARVLALLLDLSHDMVPYRAAALLLFHETTKKFSLRLQRGLDAPVEARIQAQTMEGVLFWALEQGRPVVLPGKPGDPPAGDGDRTFVVVPLVARGKSIGLLHLTVDREEGAFTQRDLSFLSVLANQASVAIENARLYETIQSDSREVVRALGRAAAAHDSSAQRMAERMAACVTLLAEALKLPPEEAEVVKNAALLHDIGMLGVPEAVLEKPGKLSPEEIRLVRTHCALGADLVGGICSLTPLVPLVLHHHERWDGTGYPAGLKGPEIPRGARLIALADAFEKMTSERPYRLALSRNLALDEIQKESGRQFDPEVVEAFLKVLPHLAAARAGEEAASS